jgi:hypothetical protein
VTYRVDWEILALAELDEIWNSAIDREGVENTATRINIELTFQPLEAGESRHDDYRVLIKFPLVVWYRVVQRIGMVQVLHVRAIRR